MHVTIARTPAAVMTRRAVPARRRTRTAPVVVAASSPEGFPKAIIQLDCALARPRRCRIYRTMGEDEEWVTEEPSPTAPLTRAKIGQLRHERSKRKFKKKSP